MFLLLCLHVQAQDKLSFSFNNIPLRDALEKIENASGYKFLYNSKTIVGHRRVSLAVNNLALPELLRKLLDKDVSFKILENKLVVIVANDKPARTNLFSGIVKDIEGKSIPGVMIRIKGKERGVETNAGGQFFLDAYPGNVIGIRYEGYVPQEVVLENGEPLNIVLNKQASELQEIVVTAMRIPKNTRSIGYSIQNLKVAESRLFQTRGPNIYAALSGKVSGLNVQHAHFMFDDPKLYLRGKNPLIVIDGVPVQAGSWSMNKDDIESITILKGPMAAALYGQQGANGAIQIEGKRGKVENGKPLTVEFNSTTEIQTGFIAIPAAQHSYGPGEYFKYAFVDGKGGGTYDYDYYVWGPRYEGQLITQWNSPLDENGKMVPLPWLSRNNNNIRDFLRKGFLTSNNIAVSGKNELGNFRISTTHMQQRGIVPNTKVGITTVNASGGMHLLNRVYIDASFSYNRQSSPNFPSINYGPESPIYELLIWNGSNFDINDPQLRNYWYPGKEGRQQRWVEYDHYNNPWFNAYEYLKAYYKDVLTGYLAMSYRFSPKLDVQFKTAVNTFYINQHQTYPVSGLYYSRDFYKVGGYKESYDNYFQGNNSFILNWKQTLGSRITMKTSLGGNVETIRTKGMAAQTSGGLIIPGIYNLQNSQLPLANAQNTRSNASVLSAYANIDLDYKSILYLNVTARGDRNSNMPQRYSTYFYPQASLSAILSDIVKVPAPVSYLKLKAAISKVGEGAAPYSLESVYTKGTNWNGSPSLEYAGNGILYNNKIKPAYNTNLETGFEMGLFNNRLFLKAQVYKTFDGPQIFPLPVSEASGYSTYYTNGLLIERRGMELDLFASIIRSKAFKWTMNFNWARDIGYLKNVYGDQPYYGRIKKGERYDQLFMNVFERNPATGNIIYQADGIPMVDSQRLVFNGYTNPEFGMGMTHNFSYRNWTLSLEMDGSVGGKIFNFVNYKMWQSGTHIDSDNFYRYQDWLNRDNPAYRGTRVGEGDMIVSGSLLRDGAGNVVSDTRVFAPNTTPVLEQVWANTYNASNEISYQSKTYFKLRNITLQYLLPAKLFNRKLPFSEASVAVSARNVLYLAHTRQIDLDRWAYTRRSDLEEPSMRSIGFNINLKF